MMERCAAFASDYDGTLADGGRVGPRTLEALGRFRQSRRKLILVTGRKLDEIIAIFPPISLFDRVVAENGALLYNPATRTRRLLSPGPPHELIAALRARNLEPLSVGEVIIATSCGQRSVVSELIEELGLDLRIILNKDSLMVLPQGTNKATGLMAALREIGVTPEDTVGVGDAENDEDFLAVCGYSAAVANALPALKHKVSIVTSAPLGAGVAELVNQLLNGGPAPKPALMEFELSNVTPREREVLDCLADGCSNREIARKLGLSVWAVKQRLRHIARRNGVNSRQMRVRLGLAWAAQNGEAVIAPSAIEFTVREISIMRQVVAELPTRTIAYSLATSEQMVKNCLQRIYNKTGMSSRLELALWVHAHKCRHLRDGTGAQSELGGGPI
jgi:hydroxymethylpyrimidine pyrophosphatase-like HAD family hydrolase/DNA-binding NarL/FixJ family response regulator